MGVCVTVVVDIGCAGAGAASWVVIEAYCRRGGAERDPASADGAGGGSDWLWTGAIGAASGALAGGGCAADGAGAAGGAWPGSGEFGSIEYCGRGWASGARPGAWLASIG
jgi:hypothetical protein